MSVSSAKIVTNGKAFSTPVTSGTSRGITTGRNGITSGKNAINVKVRDKSINNHDDFKISLKEDQEMLKDYLGGNREGLEEYVARTRRSGKPLEKIREYVTIKEAVKLIGKSDKTIRNYIKQGRLPALMDEGKYGDRYVIPLEALEALENDDYQPSIPKPAVEASTPVSTPTNPTTAVVPTYDLPVVMGMVEHRIKAMVNEAIEERWKRIEGRLEKRDEDLLKVIRDKQKEAKRRAEENRPLLGRWLANWLKL